MPRLLQSIDISMAKAYSEQQVLKALLCDRPTNCRSTRTIADWCSNVASVAGSVIEVAPQGQAVTTEVEGDPAQRRHLVETLVSGWLKDETIAARRIAILSPWRIDNGCLAGIKSIAGTSLTASVADWQVGKGVLLTTIRAFKEMKRTRS